MLCHIFYLCQTFVIGGQSFLQTGLPSAVQPFPQTRTHHTPCPATSPELETGFWTFVPKPSASPTRLEIHGTGRLFPSVYSPRSPREKCQARVPWAACWGRPRSESVGTVVWPFCLPRGDTAESRQLTLVALHPPPPLQSPLCPVPRARARRDGGREPPGHRGRARRGGRRPPIFGSRSARAGRAAPQRHADRGRSRGNPRFSH